MLVLAVGAAVYVYLVQPGAGTSSGEGHVISANPAVVTNVVENVSSVTDKVKQLPDSGVNGTNVTDNAQGDQENIDKIFDKLDLLISEDNLNEAYKLAKTLMKHPDADVRQDVVDIFGWIGLKALAGISAMLLDPDQGVASSARQHWESVVGDITDDTLKSQILTEGIKICKSQDDAEGSILLLDSMEISFTVRSLVNIIENGTPAASELAREHYEFTTDEPYKSAQAAETWLAKETAEEADEVPEQAEE